VLGEDPEQLRATYELMMQAGKGMQPPPSETEILWAASIVQTRTCSAPEYGIESVTPYTDMLNHQDTMETKKDFRVKLDPATYEIVKIQYVTAGLAPGVEVFSGYKTMSRSKLNMFHSYGFSSDEKRGQGDLRGMPHTT